MRTLCILIAFAVGLVVAGCDKAVAPSDLAPIITVQGYLYANHPVDSIIISKSLPIDAYYSDSTARVSGAIVTLVVNGTSYTLAEDPANIGSYHMQGASRIIRSGDSCSLSVAAFGSAATASTVVPDSFMFTGSLPDTLVYKVNTFPLGPQITWTRAARRSSYALSIEAMDTLIYAIIGKDTIWNQRVLNADGERSVRPRPLTQFIFPLGSEQGEMGSFLFNWYGKHRLNVFAVDTNFYDFLRQASLGRTYRPELNHVHGGIGVFGSAGRQQHDIFLKQ